MKKNTHHAIDYIEFFAPDFDKIQNFYGAVFGWKFLLYGEEYLEFHDEILIGGFAKGEAKGGYPLVIFYSDDLENSLALVEKNGGIITQKIFSFPGGRRFHFADPAGNVLAIWGK